MFSRLRCFVRDGEKHKSYLGLKQRSFKGNTWLTDSPLQKYHLPQVLPDVETQKISPKGHVVSCHSVLYPVLQFHPVLYARFTAATKNTTTNQHQHPHTGHSLSGCTWIYVCTHDRKTEKAMTGWSGVAPSNNKKNRK